MLHQNLNEEQKMFKRNLIKICWETVLTSIGAGFCISTITIFWNSVGMDQTAIGLVQMIFTIVIFALDLPLGYIADRFNRKALNVIGDIGCAIAFGVYAFSRSIYLVILSECLLGIFMAMTNGVDQGFIKYNCNKIDPTGELFKKTNIKIHTARYIALLIVVVIGGFIAKWSLRLTLGLSFIPYFIGAILALGIKDYNQKAGVRNSNPLKDLALNVKEVFQNKKSKAYLLSYILGKEITHAQIWVFTPLLIMVGVPIEIVSMGWVLNQIMQIFGSKLSEKHIMKKVSNRFLTPICT